MSRIYRQGRPTIGVLAGWQFAWTPTPLSYLDPIFRGAGLAAHDLGCNLLLGCGMGSWADRRGSLRAAWPLSSSESDFVPIGPRNTEGLITINPLHSPTRSRYVQELRAAGHPLIFVAAGERGPTIGADNRGGVLEAMQHLVEHGHRRIALIAGSPEDMEGDTGERLRAYHEAIERHGLLADPSLVAWGRHRYDGGYLAMREILASGISFTAVQASNDESALGAMQALREAGHRIPQDVAIVGFDDRPESAVQEPALSSVRIPLRNMGYRAVESLLRYLTGQTEAIESSRVETRLVARESCGCGQSTLRIAVPGSAAPQARLPDQTAERGQLVQIVAAPILAEAQCLPTAEIEALCQRLVDAFFTSLEQGDRSQFEEALEASLRQVAASGDDMHVWQAAVSSLDNALDGLQATSLNLARELLDQARITISASVQQRFRRHIVDQRWTLNRLGTLTARLLAAIDETQVYEVLAQDLPAMGIHTAWLALFGAEGDDPAAWTTLRDITSLEQDREQHALHFPSRDFPPEGLLPTDQPFSLALFPLTGPRGQLGYAVFDTAHLDLYGAITQELATALNSAQLYREATESRRLAEEANELKSRFLSTVSHELRTPLNLIVGLSGILLQESDESDSPLAEPCREDLEQIHANAQHLGGLIGDVLDLASSDAGQLRLANEFVDLGEALRLVAEAGRQLANDKELGWRAMLPESGPWVWGDRTRLRQIVLNLVNNAVKFTAQGEVCLELESGAEAVTVAVRDTGLGIPPEEQALIFDEFRRSERSIGHGYNGLGLGLAICRRLVELHGGTIGVRSSGEEGAGSTFYFTLPTVQPPAGQVQPPATLASRRQSVLVLSHRAGSSQQLLEHLAARGFDVRTAYTDETPDRLSRLVVSPPGAIVVDVSAAPHHGWDVLKAIKGHPKTQGLPVLFCSLSPDGGAVLEFDYLTKPIELADLTRALDQHWLVPDTDHDSQTILVVDDDPSTLEMHTRIVQAHSPSHRVLRAQNGLDALDLMQREQIDLVLLDLIMPELDGFGVLEAMRQQEATREIPVIVLTGQVLTERDMARLNRGVATVLGKDLFSLEETLAHVDTAMERNRRLSGEAQRLVRQAMAYIHEHYGDSISRADLARHVALSEDYLTACFRKELGVTPIAYLNRYRVHQARQLLTDTDKSITEIALQVGFSDSGYFSRVFRREVGLSPEAYRQA
jgi:signal transduction histidine kinase/AraC-like DNA-binding protein/ABC-type sugar transport system substrate-binding protein/ActR/RegA family two-component response regulator